MDAIVSALEAIQPQGDFCVRLSASVDDLQIRVGSAQPLAFPLSHDAARDLIAQARPAKFGWKDQTLQDKQVRDTWEIAKSRVKIDKRRWNKTLHPLLEQVKAGLGLDDDAKLSASLHNMLVYETGQFFQTHQDTEKADGMVATLVVALPCAHTGGSLVVDHAGEIKRVHTSRAARDKLTCVAFYADCHHQIKPLTSGYRVVLTYNLLLKGSAASEVSIPSSGGSAARLTRALGDYFERRADEVRARDADDSRVPIPPKWVYLLDHEYTEKGLSWRQLKNGDRLRADMLVQAAAELGLERYIALADIQEVWDCEDDYDDYDYRSRRRRRSYYENEYEDDEDDDEDEASGGGEDYQLLDLIDSSMSLRHWVAGGHEQADFSGLGIGSSEVCWTKATDEFDPFRSEHEGWMGNYGNTLERWYHRAAIVLWRKEDRYAMLCEIDPKQLVKDLRKLAKKPSTRVQAQDILSNVMPYWSRAIARNREADNAWTRSVLDLALRIELSERAQALVSPFDLKVLNANTAPAFMALEKQYGAPWCIRVLEHCSQQHTGWRQHKLIDGFYPLISTLCELDRVGDSGERDRGGNAVIEWFFKHQFDQLVANHSEQQQHASPVQLAKEGGSRVESAGELLNACSVARNAMMHARVASYLVKHETLYDPLALAELALQLERLGGETPAWGYQILREYAVEKLTDEFGQAVRKKDDWAIAQTVKCDCKDCQTLNRFLQASSERQKVWPLAQRRREHIHRAIDALGVPVTHRTRREGSPYRLILTKTDELVKREALRRERVMQALGKLSDVA